MPAKRFFKRNFDPLVVAVLAGVILLLISAIIPQLRGFLVKSLLWVWGGLTWVWAALIAKYLVPGWVIVIAGLWALVRLWRTVKHLSQATPPAYLNYTEDRFDGAVWRWSWDADNISDIWCFCPLCDAQLVPSEGYTETAFICDRCPSDGTLLHDRPRGRIVTRILVLRHILICVHEG